VNSPAFPPPTNALANESRLEEALLALQLFPIIPLYGVRYGPGGLECECGKSDCSGAGKHPRLKNWGKRGTRDEAVVRGWNHEWPDMNFGGVTGVTVVVDVDRKGDISGAAHFEGLFNDGTENVPLTVHSITGSSHDDDRCGHYFFSASGYRVRNSTDILPGVDVRGHGGMVVLPGSRHISGRLYIWAPDASPAEISMAPIPDLLAALLKVGKRPHPANTVPVESKPGTGSSCLKEKPPVKDKSRAFDNLLRDKYGIDLKAFRIRENAQPPGWKLTKLFSRRKRNHRAIMATWNRSRTNVEHPLRDFSPSGYEMAFAVYAACNKWTPQEICDLLVRWRCRHQLPIAKLHWKRVLTTLRKAYAAAIERGLIRKRPGKTGPLRAHLSIMGCNLLPLSTDDIDGLAIKFGVKRETVSRTILRLKIASAPKQPEIALCKAA
jgi:hypothetical protein